MSEQDEFAAALEQQRRANAAMFSGDPEPYMSMWSRTDPVSLFGAWGPCKTGWDDIARTLRWVGTRFASGLMSFDLEVVHVGAEAAHGRLRAGPGPAGRGADGADADPGDAYLPSRAAGLADRAPARRLRAAGPQPGKLARSGCPDAETAGGRPVAIRPNAAANGRALRPAHNTQFRASLRALITCQTTAQIGRSMRAARNPGSLV